MGKCKHNCNSSAGFTLLELLLVLSLIGIASVFSIASIDRLAGRVDERRWADQTQQSLAKLRNRAVLSGAVVRATLDLERGELFLVGSDAVDRLLVLPKTFRFRSPPSAATATSKPESRMSLYFYPDGTMDEAVFDLVLPSEGLRRFHLTRFTGKIERTTVNDSSR
jgi:prepilin-type N-terminal cleavage/methylation domain-containing protein